MSGTRESGFGAAVVGLLKMAGLVLAGIVVLLLVSLPFPDPLATFLGLLGVAGAIQTLVSVASMLLTFRQARVAGRGPLLLSLGATLLATLVGLWLAAESPSAGGVLASLLVGAAGGWFLARGTLLYVDGGQVRSRGTLWSLAAWALSFALNQLVTVLSGGVSAVASIAVVLSAGLTAGNTLGLLLRMRRLEAGLSPREGAGAVAGPS